MSGDDMRKTAIFLLLEKLDQIFTRNVEDIELIAVELCSFECTYVSTYYKNTKNNYTEYQQYSW